MLATQRITFIQSNTTQVRPEVKLMLWGFVLANLVSYLIFCFYLCSSSPFHRLTFYRSIVQLYANCFFIQRTAVSAFGTIRSSFSASS